ncbi:translation initiation factor eIF 4e-like domain-containing protein [Auriculariales sp. MPI-PUGE-AT-0066]|nr:translation initiation factor eIF 4e-like domain-containing protein [Auriculariales sp. MPI-PUGE-AT-0066]
MSYFSSTTTTGTTKPIAIRRGSSARPDMLTPVASTGSVPKLALQTGDAPEALAGGDKSGHPLRQSWVFWFRQQSPGGGKISTTNYEQSIRRVAAVSSVESFWTLFARVRRPSEATPTTDYMIFHSAVRRPVWEDPLNMAGGKWILRLKKGVADRLWEDLMLGVVGGQFDDPDNDAELCGVTISVRPTEDIISVWHRTTSDPKAIERIRDTVRRVLALPSTTVMDYKSNNDSMTDKSSFRNTTYDRTPISATFDRTPLTGLQER